MSQLKYTITVDEDGASSITMLLDGTPTTITHEHPNYTRIATALVEGDDPTPWLSVASQIGQVDGFDYDEDADELRYEDETVPGVVTDALVRYTTEGRDPTAVKKFMARLDDNPSHRSREQLWKWIERQGLTLDTEGYVIGYKGVQDTDDLLSINSGTAFVNGKKITGHIPNRVGSVVTMDRKDVADNPAVGCSYGLHVGTYSYARGFGRVVLEVRVDPADVVSIPSDASCEKMRCCKYEVVAIHDDTKGEDLTHHEPEATWTPETFEDTMEEVMPTPFLQKLSEAVAKLRRKSGS